MAAVVADAEWLEPHERDAVQQLLRKEYTADAPTPPPPPQQEYLQTKQQGLDQKQQRSAPQTASQIKQQQQDNAAADADRQGLALTSPGDAMEERRQQAASAEAGAPGQQAGAAPGVGTAEDEVPPGVPAEAVRLLRCSHLSSQRHLHSSRL